MLATIAELKSQLEDLQKHVDMLEQKVEQNDDFVMGINDLLTLLAEKIICNHPYLLSQLESDLKQAYYSWQRYEQGNPTEDDLLLPLERYQAKRHLYMLLSVLGKTSEKIDLVK